MTAGDRVPADVRLSQAHDLLLEESSMTGESKPQRKSVEEQKGSGEPACQSYSNMAYMGCLVLSGTGRGLVTAVGENSQFGEMVKLLSNEEPPRTPLQCRVEHYSIFENSSYDHFKNTENSN